MKFLDDLIVSIAKRTIRCIFAVGTGLLTNGNEDKEGTHGRTGEALR